MFYAGRTFTSTVTGQRIVPVNCEKCKKKFFYELVRQGVGRASAPYFLGQKSAKNRAASAAQKNLRRKLERDADLVPCPACNWVNEEMVGSYRRMRYRALRRWGIAAGIIVAVFVMPLASIILEADGRHATSLLLALGTAAFMGLICGGPFFLLQHFLRNRINPNETYPRRPALPPGTPKGWTTEELASPPPLSGKFELREDAAGPMGDWATFRAGHLVIPPQCCECLAPPTTVYRSPFTVNNKRQLEAPLCGECASRLRWQWWTTAILVIGGVFVASGIFYALIHADEVGRVTGAIMIGIFAGLFAVAIIPNWLTQPFKMRTVDASRSIFRIKFRSEQFTEMVRKACADHERATFQPPPRAG